jgi:uncharacterized Fe-S radical SAM superfamily protein PflX
VQPIQPFESNFLHLMTSICQIIGSLYVFFLGCIFFCLCSLIIDASKQRATRDKSRISALQKMVGMPYSNLVFSEGRDCVICLNAFQPEE